VLARAIKPLVSRTLTALRYPDDDCDTVLVIGWIEVALVADEDVDVIEKLSQLRVSFVFVC
jgi:hypothetical protein